METEQHETENVEENEEVSSSQELVDCLAPSLRVNDMFDDSLLTL